MDEWTNGWIISEIKSFFDLLFKIQSTVSESGLDTSHNYNCITNKHDDKIP